MLKGLFFNFLLLSVIQAFGSSPQEIVAKADSCLRIPDYACAIELYEQALKNVKSDEDKVIYLNNLAHVFYQRGDFDKAYETYSNALKIARSEKLNSQIAISQEGISHILWRRGDNVRSIESIIEAIKLFEEGHDTSSMISASNILAGIYLSMGNIDDAEEIYKEMLEVALEANDSVRIANNYEYMGIASFFREDYKKAISYYKKALLINEKIDNWLEAGINYGNIGEAYNMLEDYKKALTYFRKAITLQKRFDFNSGLIFLYYSIGDTYTRMGEYKLGMEYYNKSLDLMDQTGETREKKDVYRLMAENYSLQDNYEEAYKYHKMYSGIKDSLFNMEQNAQIENIRSQYEVEKKEQENMFLSKENMLKAQEIEAKQTTIRNQYILGAFLLLFLGISVFLSYKLYKNRNLLSGANEAKNKLFGFIAHDLRGPVGNIKALAEIISFNYKKQNNLPDENEELLNHLNTSAKTVSILLNNLLTWSVTQRNGFNFIPKKVNLHEVAEQNRALFDYQVNYKNLHIENQIPENINVWADENAVLTIIRNLVSNAVKFTHKGGKIVLNAEVAENGKFVTMSIRDNGIGITQEKIAMLLSDDTMMSSDGTDHEKGSGLGFNMIKEFVRKSKGHIAMESMPDKGTTVYVNLPACT